MKRYFLTGTCLAMTAVSGVVYIVGGASHFTYSETYGLEDVWWGVVMVLVSVGAIGELLAPKKKAVR